MKQTNHQGWAEICSCAHLMGLPTINSLIYALIHINTYSHKTRLEEPNCFDKPIPQMSDSIERLKVLLNEDALDAFLETFELYASASDFDLKCMALTQVELPSALRRHFLNSTISPGAIVSVWRMVTSGVLLLVENDLRILINRHIDASLKLVQPKARRPAKPLEIFQDLQVSKKNSRFRCPQPRPQTESIQMNRVSIVNTFEVRTWSSSSAFDLRRNMCGSPDEKEFLRAIRLYFPAFLSYPNIALHSFINLHELGAVIPDSFHVFAEQAQVNVLLCTPDEDPVAAFELDLPGHESKQSVQANKVKKTLFQLAGLPLIRIRPESLNTIRAEDFFDLLNIENASALIRPYRLHPRSKHEGLVPIGVEPVRRWRKSDETL